VVQVNTDPSNPFYVPPVNFALGDPPTYFDISTTASISGLITVCLTFPTNAFPPGTIPRLVHFVDGDWVDVTTQVDMAARVICGTVTSLSPFALGFLVPNQGPLVLKRLAVSNPRRRVAAASPSGKGAWSLRAKLNASTAAATFLQEVDTKGIEFKLDGRLGAIDKVIFAAGKCTLSRHKPWVVCRLKNGTHAVTASFKQGRVAEATFTIAASFSHRRFDLTPASLKDMRPLEVRLTTPTTLGMVTATPPSARFLRPRSAALFEV
jgi:hypothetical protein